MKFLFAALLSFAASFAHADILLGTFQGTDQNGQICEIEVAVKWYTENTPHPLNERVTVVVEGLHWDLAHPAVIDEEAGKVRFDHSYFKQVVSTSSGAEYVVMTIDHDNEPHAPTSYTYIVDNYRDSSKSRKVVCAGLVKQ